MFLPSDHAYLRAKSARRGESSISPIFADFVRAFEREFQVAPLWLETDTIPVHGKSRAVRPRLDVVLERTDEQRQFLTAPYTYDPQIQARTVRMFLEGTGPRGRDRAFQPPAGRSIGGELLVCFSSFEEVAVGEVHDLVSKEELEAFAQALDLGESYWRVERFMGTPPTVFVQTSEQVAALEGSPVRDQWDDAYFELAKSRDEFGYLDRRTTFVRLDSKQNFDENYAGNWYYYWK
ncbi:MAG TPA: hypothetical protein VFJ09_01785 [Nocardioidaceae bacterium]|nr:hypothetical protein [Nocardioidaceae bacterium]